MDLSVSPFIDAHCHLSDDRVSSQVDSMIHRARVAGLGTLMLGGTHEAEWFRQIQLKQAHPDLIKTSFGLHPWWVEKMDDKALESQFLILHNQALQADAIGETGLDFYQERNPLKFDLQRKSFRLHLELAKQLRKPLVLHVVGAHSEALKHLQEVAPAVPLLVHRFSGSAEEALEWTRFGAFLSFSGSLLRVPPSKKTISALEATPRTQLLFETDAPDGGWRRDLINEPALVVEIYQAASRILGCSLSELRQIVAENFAKIR